MLAMHIIAHFFPIFLKISRSSDDKKQMKEEGDVDVEVEVEVDEKR